MGDDNTVLLNEYETTRRICAERIFAELHL